MGRPTEITQLDMIREACENVLGVAEAYRSKALRRDYQLLRDALEDAAIAFVDNVKKREARSARRRWRARAGKE